MTHFADRLFIESKNKNTALVVGLDPNPTCFPNFLLDGDTPDSIGRSIVKFNKLVIDAVHKHVVAIKPQLAYYEQFGSAGLIALEETISYAKSKDLPVINDAKRNDIGPTASAYAKAFLGHSSFSADAVTVTPYLGRDGITPFVEMCRQNNRGIFVLVKTSNPSAADIQDLKTEHGIPLYQEVSNLLQRSYPDTVGDSSYSFIGAVVGATYPQIAYELRQQMPHTLFLVPGFGAQGGQKEDLAVFFDAQGFGALISTSRAVLYPYLKQDNWQSLSEQDLFSHIHSAALTAQREINEVRFLNKGGAGR